MRVPRILSRLRPRDARTQAVVSIPAERPGRNGHAGLLAEDAFVRMLSLERKRTERSRNPFLLMLLAGENSLFNENRETLLPRLVAALASATRETDLAGWYEQNAVVGVIFTELNGTDHAVVARTLGEKTSTALLEALGSDVSSQIRLSFHHFPESTEDDTTGRGANTTLYPDLFQRKEEQKLSLLVKRAADILGASLALALSAPLFLLVAAAIKLTSKGPVLFRQERVGQYGHRFTFLKFRSMYVSNDASVHRDYVSQFIAGQAEAKRGSTPQEAVYKILDDPRVTPIGRFLRKTSLDELPQFWNVLKGEMSLVGPRPPIPYEFDSYDIWHRRRVLEVKPGITGLWQVNGRSKTTFDDMVRLDLCYARAWSLWLDFKILLQTPRAVLSGEGAY